MLNRCTKDDRKDDVRVFALLAGKFFSAFCRAAHLNFYSAADRLTDELTDSVDVDTASKESRARANS